MSLNVTLIAHTQLSEKFVRKLRDEIRLALWTKEITNGQAVGFTAIRTCYSPLKPTEILETEFDKYFKSVATDGLEGTDADRLIRQIVNSKHLSTLEHITFTFAIENVSRALLAQLTRHRVGFSYSVQSQRYVKFGSNDKSGGAGFVIPPSIEANEDAKELYLKATKAQQEYYDLLRELGIPAEDARMVLINGTTCNLVMSANVRSLLDFYSKRRKGRGAQWEIAELAEALRREVADVEPWLDQFFERV